MSVEYVHHAFVRGAYRPSAERVARFIRLLGDERWIVPIHTLVARGVSRGRFWKAAQRTGAVVGSHFLEFKPAPFFANSGVATF